MEKILIVDNSMFNRKVLAMYLGGEYEILSAANDAVGVQLAKIHAPSLILLDAEMSDINSYPLLEALKSNAVTRDIPVIIMVGAGQSDIETGIFFYGAADFIRKPLRQEVVCARVRVHIQRHIYRKMLEAKLLIDMETGVHNRKCADLLLNARWNQAQRSQEPLSVAIIDIDHLADVAKRYGFEQAERVLKQVAVVARTVIEAHNGFIARYEGDKFIIVLADTGAQAAESITEDIRLAVLEQVTVGSNAPEHNVVSVSIGGAGITGEGGKELGECLNTAKAMLRVAKSEGRNCVRFSQCVKGFEACL